MANPLINSGDAVLVVYNVGTLTLDAVCLCITGDVSCFVSVCSDVYALG